MRKILLVFLVAAGLLSLAYGVYANPPGHTSGFSGPVTNDDPLPDELIAALENYVEDAMRRNDVPGLAMALVHGDQVVYSRAFGVRDLATREPVTTETLMGIGSTTKSMTAVMIASMVDAGVLTWDTPVTDVLPSFAVSDPDITRQITFEHLLCMCTGVPRRMEEITFRYADLSAEDIIKSLAEIPLQGRFEHSFRYSSRMVAAAGYIAGLADGGEYGSLASAYDQTLHERVLDPLGMTSSTLSIREATESGNYATPYYSGLDGFRASPPEVEGVFTPIAPAGALWSNVDEMSRYLIMLLNEGVSGSGRRIVSAENLAFTWQPRAVQDETFRYGLGWDIENYNGLTVIQHPGGTVGFASELVVIPELNVGLVLLTNRVDLAAPIGRMTVYRLLEMLTGQPQNYDRETAKTQREISTQLLGLAALTAERVDPDEIFPFLGRYRNETLGDVEILLHPDRSLWMDVGEYEIPMRRLRSEENQFILYESAFLGKTLSMSRDSKGLPVMRIKGDEGVTYTFESVRPGTGE